MMFGWVVTGETNMHGRGIVEKGENKDGPRLEYELDPFARLDAADGDAVAANADENRTNMIE